LFLEYRYQVIILKCSSHISWVLINNVSEFSLCYFRTSKCIGSNLIKM
jgi:hypothetical protein